MALSGNQPVRIARENSSPRTAKARFKRFFSISDSDFNCSDSNVKNTHRGSYDAIISINVIEHVQNVIAYFHSLHTALLSGGILIFHDRFYPNPPAGDAVLGENIFHPIRLTVDVFLSDFDIVFDNCDGHHLIKG